MAYRISQASTEGMDNAHLAWAVIERIWRDLDLSKGPQKVEAFLKSLTPGQRSLIALDWFQKEVRNGGFVQFFQNSTGMLWSHALEGLEMINANEYASTLRRALSVFPESKPPLARTERVAILRATPKETKTSIFEPLEQEFYALLRSSEHDLESYRAKFIRDHPTDFFQ